VRQRYKNLLLAEKKALGLRFCVCVLSLRVAPVLLSLSSQSFGEQENILYKQIVASFIASNCFRHSTCSVPSKGQDQGATPGRAFPLEQQISVIVVAAGSWQELGKGEGSIES
jgi:hypothetical protein